VLLKLEELQDEQIKQALAPVTLSDDERAEAIELLHDPRLLDRIVEDFSRCGVVGPAASNEREDLSRRGNRDRCDDTFEPRSIASTRKKSCSGRRQHRQRRASLPQADFARGEADHGLGNQFDSE
jgi:hypothetical protein